MMSVWQIPAAMLALLAWLTSPSTSLADAARREAFRRQVTARSQSTYSNQTLPPARPGDLAVTVSPSAEAASAGDDEPAHVTAEVASAVGADTAGANDEKAWRERASGLTSTLASDLVLVESLQARVAGLQNDFYSRDDPAQRAMLGEQLAKTRVELERLKTKVDADRAAIDKLKDDGRRQGVPPGWLR